MHFCRVYGLRVQSQFNLYWPQPASQKYDVAIVRGEVPHTLLSAVNKTDWFQAAEKEVLISIPDVGRFLVQQDRIVVAPSQTAADDVIAPYLLGPCLGALLQRRGKFVLHASAVRLPNGRAVAFAGEQTAGKSTTARYFYHHGCPLVSDDLCVLTLRNSATTATVMVEAGYPRLKLDPVVLNTFGESAATYQRIIGRRRTKYVYRADKGFQLSPIPLEAIYFLAEGDHTAIASVPAQMAVAALMHNRFRARFLVSPRQRQDNLSQCAAMLKHLQVRRLTRPRRMEEMPGVIQQVISQHAA